MAELGMTAHEMPQEICLLQVLKVSGVSEQQSLSPPGGNLFLRLMNRRGKSSCMVPLGKHMRE